VFAKKRPDAGEVGDVDSDRGFAGVPEHVGCCIDVGEVVDFCKNCGDDLESSHVSGC
jgi:hypothetical protein